MDGLIIPGMGDLTREVMAELSKGRLAKLVMAERVQRRAAAAAGERRTLRHGEVQMQVHPQFFHYWGQRLGYDCWEDPQFVREFLRDNPEARVKSRPRNLTVAVPAFAGNKRFSKRYAA
jgi:hypothetical protein